ncbi:sodium-dependent noradrenaline transporter-like isoform X1 [Haliotis rubra]|uniref:sodium-dependent noradrenaline transporter-like isoform X1 n=1 Tax=Haliotis rubra TaxID=36100 RepID=UPI001EE5F887|nr:sodium-dependent noradrenaline transporter-like isoform X1 [Haliotis rubra]
MAELAMGRMEDQNHGVTREEDHTRETNHPSQLTEPVQPSTFHPPPPYYQPPLSTQMLSEAGHENVTSFVLEAETNNCGNSGFQRERWTSNVEFIASVLALNIDYGTFTVLPYSSSRYSVAFMAAFAAFYFVIGVPILYMDLSLGQFSSRGPAHIWNLCPLFRGIGVGMMVYSAIFLPAITLFSSWSLYYVVQSFSPMLPWSNCNNAWNTPTCFNSTTGGPGVQYLHKRVLQVSESSGIDDMGGLQWELVGCCAGLSVVVFFALFWGVKVLGKVFCITMSLMSVLALVLFIKAMTLPGSSDGLAYLFTLNFRADLTSKHIWLWAFLRAMFTVGMTSGLVNNLASYRHFKSSALRDSVIICSVGAVGRLLAALMMMSLTGALANTKQTSIYNVETAAGIVSAHEYIPELFPHLPASQFWSFAYFCILLLVGLNSQFVYADMIITAVVDSLPRRSRMIRIMITVVTCIATLLITLPYLAKGGVILMVLVDSYIIKVSIYILGILQFLTVGWIYGMGRLGRDIEMMTGTPPPIVIKFIWCFILPPVLLIFLVLSFIDYTAPVYIDDSRTIVYPVWAHVLGWFIALVQLAPVPVFALLALVTSSQHLFSPRPEWGPTEDSYKRQYDSQRQYNVTLTERITSIFTN